VEKVSVAGLPVLPLVATGAPLATAFEPSTLEPSPAGALKIGVAPCRVGSAAGFGAAFTGAGFGAGVLVTATCGAGAGSLPPEEASE
jgi:hypothetical protein